MAVKEENSLWVLRVMKAAALFAVWALLQKKLPQFVEGGGEKVYSTFLLLSNVFLEFTMGGTP